jgi:hypothetical protein
MRWRARFILFLLAVLCAAFIELLCASLASAQVHQIDWISPDHVIAGSGDIVLTVYGANMNHQSFPFIVFNGNGFSATVIDAHTIQATIPAADLKAIGAYPVYVNTTPQTNSLRFRVLSPLASLKEYSPTQFPSAVNTPVTVYGQEFPSDATILFDFQPITTTFISSTELTGTVPGSLIASSTNATHHILVYDGPFTAASIATIQRANVIVSDQPQISLSNVVIGTSLTGTATIRAAQGTVTLSSPFYTIAGPDSADFSNTGGTCANGKLITVTNGCTAQITATPAAFPAPPPGWTPDNSYALNFEIVDNGNRDINATPHLQKVTTAGTSGIVEPGGFGTGAIFTSVLDDAGTGYAANDTFTVDGGATLAAGTVTSIGGGGATTGINIDAAAGLGYSLGTHVATTATSGSGSGMTVDITALTFDQAVRGDPWNESGGTTTTDGSAVWTDQGLYILNVSESATLTINSNAANNPQSVPLSLTKSYPSTASVSLLSGVFQLNPDGYDFGSVTESTPTTRTITAQNKGGGYLNFDTPFYTITGANAADFVLSGGTCADGQFLNSGSGITSSPGQTCTFNLTFTASTAAAKTATLTLNWGSIGGTVGSATQVLTGTGVASPTKIHLAWTASISSSVTGYSVYRGAVSGGPYTLLASPGNVVVYDDTTPVHGNTYCYVVTALSTTPPYTIPASGNSNEACATF